MAAFIVRRTRIIGTRCYIYSVWEVDNGHSTISSVDGATGYYGRVGTRRLPAELDVLPTMSKVRSAAVDQWHQSQYTEAYAAIEAAYPDVDFSAAVRCMGEFEVWLDPEFSNLSNQEIGVTL